MIFENTGKFTSKLYDKHATFTILNYPDLNNIPSQCDAYFSSRDTCYSKLNQLSHFRHTQFVELL